MLPSERETQEWDVNNENMGKVKMSNNIKIVMYWSVKACKNQCQCLQYDMIPGEMKMSLQQLANKIHVSVKVKIKSAEHISALVCTLA